jgi:molecular chaperone HtpG
MPDSYNLVVNTDHELIKSLMDKISQSTMAQVAPLNNEISTLQTTVNKINEMNKDKKDEEIAEADKGIIKENNDKISGLNSKKDEIYKEFAKNEDMVRQIIDLALLANNMLKGEALSKFVKRSTSFIK